MNKKIIILCLLYYCCGNPVLAKERPWLEISNDYFRVYTNAEEKSVMGLLEELELFRIATKTFLNISVPSDAKKPI